MSIFKFCWMHKKIAMIAKDVILEVLGENGLYVVEFGSMAEIVKF
ncbi:MAG: hypothetical protein Q8836_02595 [Sweet potato little leaf phytoplasma]|nr:hypothetical protein [Sweet potato little leaf phytoplasma]